jgi:signal transduction histidine kinase
VLVQEIGAFTKATFPRSLKIQVTAPENLSPILGSAAQLHRALLNLCINARDAMPDGGRLTIRAANVSFEPSPAGPTAVTRGGHYVLFEVSDTGSGIPEAILEKIFDPFFTTKAAGKGTGLGLASVRSIVESHGGLLSVQTEPRKGSTFHILIPASEPEECVLLATEEIRIVAA